jgi:predicted Zn-dependent protease
MSRWIALLLCLVLPLQGVAEGLPNLGDASQTTVSPQLERKIGEQVVREIKRDDPEYLEDADITDYLNDLGYRLAAASPEATQDFEFFVLKDPTMNAFALPGGYIFVHTQIFVEAESESELASVLAHEMGHVVQHHMARQVEQQSLSTIPLLVAMMIGLLAARSNAQIGQAAMAGAQAVSIQSQLNYSRDYEREADRVGLQILKGAGFDVHAMPTFYERMQRFTRIYDGMGVPTYLRTHPVTSERIADIENRIQDVGYKQSPDSIDFSLVRAKLRAEQNQPQEAVKYFAKEIRDKSYASPVAAHYGMARALLRAKDFAGAQREIDTVHQLSSGSSNLRSPIIDNLAGQIKLDAGDSAGALEVYAAALKTYPHSKALIYANGEALLGAKRVTEAAKFVNDELQSYSHDERLFDLQARIYTAQGKQMAQHRALGELMALRGNLPAAIDQFQLAQKSPDGDFFEQSGVDSRLRELRRMRADEEKEQKLFK